MVVSWQVGIAKFSPLCDRCMASHQRMTHLLGNLLHFSSPACPGSFFLFMGHLVLAMSWCRRAISWGTVTIVAMEC